MADGRTDFPLPVGERLRQARLTRKLSLDDVAAQTRVPTRHLDAIERGDWKDLPAPTYSIGFAKAFADVVGLDRQEVGDELRAELGGARVPAAVETFQPADPARVPPRTLAIIAAIIAVALLAGYGYYRSVALGDVQPEIYDETMQTAPAAPRAGVAAPVVAAPGAIGGPVVITANEDVWIQVYERGGATLRTAVLAGGQSYQVPETAIDPLLRTGRAELLRISVGTADAPPVGPPNRLVKDVSLRPAALMAAAPSAGGAPPSANVPPSDASPPQP